jgi:hypothetical protein
MSIYEGEHIQIDASDHEWAHGTRCSQGWFPTEHIHVDAIHKDPTPSTYHPPCINKQTKEIVGRALAHFCGVEHGKDYLSFRIGDCVALQYLHSGDPSWAYGHCSREGWFPQKFINGEGRVLASFDGSEYGEDYISILEGDQVQVDTTGSEWAHGKHCIQGWFPADYVQVDGIGKALAPSNYEGGLHGTEYLSFSEGDWLKVDFAIDALNGWVYAEHLARDSAQHEVARGWMPKAFWQQWEGI